MNQIRRVRTKWVDDGDCPNIFPRGAAETAAWIWHPELGIDQEAFVRFKLDFNWPGGQLGFSVTADQRFVLCLNGVGIARGPDGSPPEAWTFATYAVDLGPGEHCLEAEVWWAQSSLPSNAGGHRATTASAPLARMSWRGGFLLASEDSKHAARLNTGLASWRCGMIGGWAFDDVSLVPDICHTVGKSLTVDAVKFRQEPTWEEPAVVRQPVTANPYGLVLPGWRLEPSQLPEQTTYSHLASGGRFDVVAVLPDASRTRGEGIYCIDTESGWAPVVSELELRGSVDGGGWDEIAPHSEAIWLLDLKDYVTGYLQIEALGNLEVEALWAETLFEDASLATKGNRDMVFGKWFSGFGDRFIFRGDVPSPAETHWWRAGRYLLIRVKCLGPQPGRIRSLDILRTCYPLAKVGGLQGSADFAGILEICERGLRRSLHDGPCDSPYYEQQCYVADARIELLISGYLAADEVLGRWVIETMDRSRDRFGWTAMRFPSADRQESGTFAMQWIWMLHDHWTLYGDRRFLLRMMPAVETLLRACSERIRPDGILGKVPGWPFVDWVEGWDHGAPAGARSGTSGCVNATYLLTLRMAEELARASGRSITSISTERRRMRKILRTQFSADGWICELPGSHKPSLHAQVLGLLGGAITKVEARATLLPWLRGGLIERDPEAPSLFFLHYVFEAIHVLGEARILPGLLEPWRAMICNGMLCPPEKEDPARSDCHAWSSHPAYHLLASVGGIRPAAPGFRAVRIRPALRALVGTSITVATRLGAIRMRCDDSSADIELPEGMIGQVDLGAGWQQISSGRSLLQVRGVPPS